jgi:hypothetical protein
MEWNDILESVLRFIKGLDLIMAVLNMDFYLPVVLEEASRVAATLWMFPWIADGLHTWMVLIRAVRGF